MPGQEMKFYTRKVAVVVVVASLVAVFLFLSWQVSQVLLSVFAAVLFAILLDAPTHFLIRRLKLSRSLSLALVVTVLSLVVILFVLASGPRLSEQMAQLGERVPVAVEHLKARLAEQDWAKVLIENFPEPAQLIPSGKDILGTLPGMFSSVLGITVNIGIVLLIGGYLAVNPAVYTKNLLRLLPLSRRERGKEVLAALGHVLRWWLLGRITAMIVVGVLTTLSLSAIGVPLALALGVIAGLLSFIPYFGPLLSVIPALLIALVEGPVVVLYVILVYMGVQFLEGNFLTPIIQQRTISLPPAVLLTSQLLMAGLFGFYGMLLATPLAAAVIVLVQMLYIEDVLGEDVTLLGD
jgi:predicted PurR-regulated permease PerM